MSRLLNITFYLTCHLNLIVDLKLARFYHEAYFIGSRMFYMRLMLMLDRSF